MTRNSVKISVIMPAYNAARYIDSAIRSVLTQKNVHFELLVGDDGSTDETWQRLQRYQEHSKLRMWKFQKNLGPAVIRNRLIDLALGSYIAFCDADDIMLPNHLKKLSQTLDKKPKIGVVYGDIMERSPSGKFRLLRRSLGFVKTWDLIDGSISNVGTLVRRNIVKNINGYRTELPFLEDCDLFLRLAEKTQFEYLKSKPTYIYRRHCGSLSNQPKKRWRTIGRKIIKDAILRRYGVKAKW